MGERKETQSACIVRMKGEAVQSVGIAELRAACGGKKGDAECLYRQVMGREIKNVGVKESGDVWGNERRVFVSSG